MPLLVKTKAHVNFASMYLHIPKGCSKLIRWKNTDNGFLIDTISYFWS